MKIKATAILLVVLTVLSVTAFYGCSDNNDNTLDGFTFEYEQSTDSYNLVSYEGYDTELTLPTSFNGKPVRNIGNNAFYMSPKLKKLNIGEGIENIGLSAVRNCDLLEEINIPASVVKISDYAFSDCSSLKSINVAQANTSYSSEDGVLFNKAKTELLIYPIKRSATSVTELTLEEADMAAINDLDVAENTAYLVPDEVTDIAESAFFGCGTVNVLILPQSIKNIKSHAFEKCRALRYVNFGGTETIGSYAFNECISLASVDLPDSVKLLGEHSFSNCDSIRRVSMGNGLTKTSDFAFSSCKSLAEAVVGSSVTSIEANTFYACNSLGTITLPSELREIKASAFTGCENLESIRFAGNETQFRALKIGIGNDYFNNADTKKYYG